MDQLEHLSLSTPLSCNIYVPSVNFSVIGLLDRSPFGPAFIARPSRYKMVFSGASLVLLQSPSPAALRVFARRSARAFLVKGIASLIRRWRENFRDGLTKEDSWVSSVAFPAEGLNLYLYSMLFSNVFSSSFFPCSFPLSSFC